MWHWPLTLGAWFPLLLYPAVTGILQMQTWMVSAITVIQRASSRMQTKTVYVTAAALTGTGWRPCADPDMQTRTETVSVTIVMPEDMRQVPDAAPELWTPSVRVHPARDTTEAGTAPTMDGRADIAGESKLKIPLEKSDIICLSRGICCFGCNYRFYSAPDSSGSTFSAPCSSPDFSDFLPYSMSYSGHF